MLEDKNICKLGNSKKSGQELLALPSLSYHVHVKVQIINTNPPLIGLKFVIKDEINFSLIKGRNFGLCHTELYIKK